MAREIFSALAEDEEMAKRVGLAVIYALGRARSYGEAIERARCVQRTVRAWEEELYEALETTLENDQVSESVVTREIIDPILDDNYYASDTSVLPSEAPF